MLVDLRSDLAGSPVAAIELEVDGSPPGARLRHVRSEPITVRVGTVTVEVTAFDRGYTVRAPVRAPCSSPSCRVIPSELRPMSRSQSVM